MSDEAAPLLAEAQQSTLIEVIHPLPQNELRIEKQKSVSKRVIAILAIFFLTLATLLCIIGVILYFAVIPPMIKQIINASNITFSNMSIKNPTYDSFEADFDVKITTNSSLSARILYMNVTAWQFGAPAAHFMLPPLYLDPYETNVHTKTTVYFLEDPDEEDDIGQNEEKYSITSLPAIKWTLVGHLGLIPTIFPFKFDSVPFNKTVIMYGDNA